MCKASLANENAKETTEWREGNYKYNNEGKRESERERDNKQMAKRKCIRF